MAQMTISHNGVFIETLLNVQVHGLWSTEQGFIDTTTWRRALFTNICPHRGLVNLNCGGTVGYSVQH